MTLYRTNFGPVDDGSTDTMEAHDAWSEVQDQVRDGWLVEVESSTVLWCETHYRIPEDGTDLCGDEWRDIGPCRFVHARIVTDGAVGEETP